MCVLYMCVYICVYVCVCALYACSALFLILSGRRMCSWTVQDISNGEDYAIPPGGNGEPVYDCIDNPAAQCGDNCDEEAGPIEPRCATLHSARTPQRGVW